MQRVIDLEGCLNFRDLGGYPTTDGRRVRWRRAFRADGLHLLTPADVARIRDELGIGDVIDLRSSAERRADPPRPLDRASGVRVHHAPLFDGDTRRAQQASSEDLSLADRYLALVGMAQEPISRTIGVIAAAPGGAVFHCAAGKDRTGIVSAILLDLLGVPPEIIAVDYAATQENLEQIVERLMSTRGYESMLETLPPDTLHAEPQTMVDLLDGFHREHGSGLDYVRSAGIAREAVERLRAKLLEGP